MTACDICEISEYPNGCNSVPEEVYKIFAACGYKSSTHYVEALKNTHEL